MAAANRATVIVALPATDEPVNKISSEEVPHLTLLYLGNVQLSAEAVLYVQHAMAELSPFGLSVDYRGTLGDDDADVIFFEKNAWDLDRVSRFRHHLLLNDEIKRAYDAAPQYPEWTPHLTLGYPESPANESDDEERMRMRYIDFDRVAIWMDDYDGPEFRLKYADHAMEVAMSDISTLDRGAQAAAELFHYGVKGMKWGVRRDRGHEGEAVKTKKLPKLDKKWEKENTGQAAFIKAHNASADRMNNGLIDKFNNDPRWKDVDLSKDGDLEKTYMDEFFAMSDKVFNEELVKLGSNPSGTKAYVMVKDDDGNEYAQLMEGYTKDEAEHAEGDTAPAFRLNRSVLGHVTSITVVERELKHYGVKGMRWGVRKDEATSRGGASSGPTSVVVTQKKPGKFAKASGGKQHPITEDAREALEIRQKAKSSTTDALTNRELQIAINRMNLENNFHGAAFNSDRRSKGARFAAGLFGMKRYGGKEKRRFTDSSEQIGEQTRKAYDTVREVRRAS